MPHRGLAGKEGSLSLQIDPVREHELQQEDQACHKKRWRIIKMVMFLRRPGGQSQFSTHLGSEADAVRDSRWIQTWVLGQPDPDKGREVFSSLSVEAHSRPDVRGLQTWILAHPHADLSIEALSERVAISPRNRADIFHRAALFAVNSETTASRRLAAGKLRRLQTRVSRAIATRTPIASGGT
jgi:transcriptional regulator GlxA family with amidase domain